MTQLQLRKLNVLIEKQIITWPQLRLLVLLISNPTTTLTDLCAAYYGKPTEGQKTSLRTLYIRKYLKILIVRLDYWGLPYIIVVHKDGTVTLREKVELDDKSN